jgi:hypothetical protein
VKAVSKTEKTKSILFNWNFAVFALFIAVGIICKGVAVYKDMVHEAELEAYGKAHPVKKPHYSGLDVRESDNYLIEEQDWSDDSSDWKTPPNSDDEEVK